jgi:hypothetical protein
MEYTFWIPTIISIVSLIWNYSQNKKIIRLETEAEAKKLIHKFQFEKEFSIYNDLWAKLVDLRNAAASLRPIVETVDISKTEQERRTEKLNTLQAKFNEVVRVFEYNRPFYAREIYKEVEKVLRTSRFEATDFHLLDSTTKEYWEQGEKNIKTITDSVDRVSDLIRKRIEFVETK